MYIYIKWLWPITLQLCSSICVDLSSYMILLAIVQRNAVQSQLSNEMQFRILNCYAIHNMFTSKVMFMLLATWSCYSVLRQVMLCCVMLFRLLHYYVCCLSSGLDLLRLVSSSSKRPITWTVTHGTYSYYFHAIVILTTRLFSYCVIC